MDFFKRRKKKTKSFSVGDEKDTKGSKGSKNKQQPVLEIYLPPTPQDSLRDKKRPQSARVQTVNQDGTTSVKVRRTSSHKRPAPPPPVNDDDARLRIAQSNKYSVSDSELYKNSIVDIDLESNHVNQDVKEKAAVKARQSDSISNLDSAQENSLRRRIVHGDIRSGKYDLEIPASLETTSVGVVTDLNLSPKLAAGIGSKPIEWQVHESDTDIADFEEVLRGMDKVLEDACSDEDETRVKINHNESLVEKSDSFVVESSFRTIEDDVKTPVDSGNISFCVPDSPRDGALDVSQRAGITLESPGETSVDSQVKSYDSPRVDVSSDSPRAGISSLDSPRAGFFLDSPRGETSTDSPRGGASLDSARGTSIDSPRISIDSHNLGYNDSPTKGLQIDPLNQGTVNAQDKEHYFSGSGTSSKPQVTITVTGSENLLSCRSSDQVIILPKVSTLERQIPKSISFEDLHKSIPGQSQVTTIDVQINDNHQLEKPVVTSSEESFKGDDVTSRDLGIILNGHDDVFIEPSVQHDVKYSLNEYSKGRSLERSVKHKHSGKHVDEWSNTEVLLWCNKNELFHLNTYCKKNNIEGRRLIEISENDLEEALKGASYSTGKRTSSALRKLKDGQLDSLKRELKDEDFETLLDKYCSIEFLLKEKSEEISTITDDLQWAQLGGEGRKSIIEVKLNELESEYYVLKTKKTAIMAKMKSVKQKTGKDKRGSNLELDSILRSSYQTNDVDVLQLKLAKLQKSFEQKSTAFTRADLEREHYKKKFNKIKNDCQLRPVPYEKLDESIPLWESLKPRYKGEVLQALKDEMEENRRQKIFLDRLLSVVINNAPHLIKQVHGRFVSSEDLDSESVEEC